MSDPLADLSAQDVSIWLDDISRERLRTGNLADSATLFLMAIGMTYVVYIGSIDLSMQAVAAVSSIVLALQIPRYGVAGIAVALAAGAAFGSPGIGAAPLFPAVAVPGATAAAAAFGSMPSAGRMTDK